MTIRDGLRKYPQIEADLFLAHILKQSKEFLYMHPEKVLTMAQARKFGTMARQRARGVPAAYVLGYKDFYGLRFKVSPDVLIPRPESEWLVDQAVAEIKRRRGKLLVLDMGTGSGCLIVSLAKAMRRRNNIEHVAVDASKKALSMAKKNAVKHGVRVKFIQSDLFQKVPGRFDLIIANLPYVPKDDYKKLYVGLRHEPKASLTEGTNEWKLYKKFIRHLPDKITDNSAILLEMDRGTRKAIQTHVKNYLPDFIVHFSKDLGNLWRYAIISRSKSS
jgi:release factor glutamine methyltransferase